MRRGSVELPLAASRDSTEPLAVQIVAQFRAAMTEGRLAGGERLPASRALAAELGVSRTVVNGAYAQLFAEGWIEGRHGSGTYVADGASSDRAAGTPPATALLTRAAGPLPGRYSPADPPGPRPRSICGPAFPRHPASTRPPGGEPGGSQASIPPPPCTRPGFPNSAQR